MAFGHVFVLVGIVQSVEKWWWKNFWQFFSFFAFFDQKCDFGPRPKISNTSSKIFPEKWPKSSLGTSRLWKHIVFDVTRRQKIEIFWKNQIFNFFEIFCLTFFPFWLFLWGPIVTNPSKQSCLGLRFIIICFLDPKNIFLGLLETSRRLKIDLNWEFWTIYTYWDAFLGDSLLPKSISIMNIGFIVQKHP